MAWHDKDSWLTAAFSPNLTTISIVLLIALLLPILLHSFLYRQAAATSTVPTFLLVGPSGAGKTAFTTLAERNTPTQTHTSTAPHTTTLLLPSPHIPASSSYRTPGDPAFERARRLHMLDTPGHGKLRHHALSSLGSGSNLAGLIFMVDAAALAEESGLMDAAEYLHDLLLALQKGYTGVGPSKAVPVLVAANKMDLFTALPANLVKRQLEQAISEVRKGRAKALRDGGAALSGGEDEVDEEKEWLGEGGEGAFEFGMVAESGVEVRVEGGSVVEGVEGWWGWVGERM